MTPNTCPEYLNDEDAMVVDSPVEQQSPSVSRNLDLDLDVSQGMAKLIIDDLNAGEPMCLDEPETQHASGAKRQCAVSDCIVCDVLALSGIVG
ncbi:hypothetical protein CcaCcLH18_12063 [Colletotrichum camelliae]|nr:hypothetical protein CcaCcLH18_12063 [Colletotrichum camelliae]